MFNLLTGQRAIRIAVENTEKVNQPELGWGRELVVRQ